MVIDIIKNQYGSLFAVSETGPLFQFEYRDGTWYFWLSGQFDPDKFMVPKKSFPRQFFEHACTAKHFIACGMWDELVYVGKGVGYIK